MGESALTPKEWLKSNIIKAVDKGDAAALGRLVNSLLPFVFDVDVVEAFGDRMPKDVREYVQAEETKDGDHD